MSLVPIQLPLGGMDRQFGFERQKQATTPHAINVWPRQARRRKSLAQRPGLKRFYDDYLPGPINMLAQADVNEDFYFRYIDDDFSGYNYAAKWSSGVGGLTVPTLDFLNHLYYADYHATNRYGFFLPALGQADGYPVYVQLKILPYDGENSAAYRVYFMLNDTNPDPTSAGVIVTLTMSKVSGHDRLSWRIDAWNTGASAVGASPYTGTFDLNLVDARWLRVGFIKSTGAVTIYADYASVTSQTITDPTIGVGTRVGWSMAATASGDRAIVDRVRVNYQHNSETRTMNVARLVVGGGGEIWHETYGNRISEVDADWSLVEDVPVIAASRLGSLYIADHGDVLYDDPNAVVGFNDPANDNVAPFYWKFESSPQIDLSALGIDEENFVVEVVALYAAGGTELSVTEFALGAYTFTFETGSATNSRVVCVRPSTYKPSTPGVATAHIRIRRGPKVYNATAGTISKLETDQSVYTEDGTYGIVPVGCHSCCEYGDRLVMIDDTTYYASRIGEFTDFGYGVDPYDPAKAWAGSLAEAGSLGRKPTACIAFSDDVLLLAAEDMIMRMLGDIGDGGRLEVASRTVGIVGRRAWCLTPDGMLWFMARDGVYRMAPGGGQYPEPVSQYSLPDELRGLTQDQTTVSMAYDPRWKAIKITLGGVYENERRDSWYLDVESGGFWPWRIPDGIEPTCVIQGVRGYFYGEVTPLVGCRDGYVRFFDRASWLDDGGTQVDSILSIGPLRAGPNSTAVRALDINLSTDSRPTYVTVETAATPEDAVSRAVHAPSYDFRHTLTAARNRGVTARGVGGAAMVTIRSLTGGPWSLEEMWADLEPIGRVL